MDWNQWPRSMEAAMEYDALELSQDEQALAMAFKALGSGAKKWGRPAGEPEGGEALEAARQAAGMFAFLRAAFAMVGAPNAVALAKVAGEWGAARALAAVGGEGSKTPRQIRIDFVKDFMGLIGVDPKEREALLSAVVKASEVDFLMDRPWRSTQESIQWSADLKAMEQKRMGEGETQEQAKAKAQGEALFWVDSSIKAVRDEKHSRGLLGAQAKKENALNRSGKRLLRSLGLVAMSEGGMEKLAPKLWALRDKCEQCGAEELARGVFENLAGPCLARRGAPGVEAFMALAPTDWALAAQAALSRREPEEPEIKGRALAIALWSGVERPQWPQAIEREGGLGAGGEALRQKLWEIARQEADEKMGAGRSAGALRGQGEALERCWAVLDLLDLRLAQAAATPWGQAWRESLLEASRDARESKRWLASQEQAAQLEQVASGAAAASRPARL